jgi:hypothetical protein
LIYAAAEKYCVVQLKQKIIIIMNKVLNCENVLYFQDFLTFYPSTKDEDLAEIYRIIDNLTVAVFKSNNFLQIGRETLSLLLKRDSLNITEVELYKSVVKYVDTSLMKKKIEINSSSRRAEMGDLIYLIRFTIMNEKEFLIPAKDKILNDEEIKEIFLFLNDKTYQSGIVNKFKFYPRESSKFDAKYSIRLFNPDSVVSREMMNTIVTKLSLNKGLILHSIEYQVKGDFEIIGTIEIIKENVSRHSEILYKRAFKDLLSFNGFLTFKLDNPISLQPNTFYIIKLKVLDHIAFKLSNFTSDSVTFENMKDGICVCLYKDLYPAIYQYAIRLYYSI